MREVEQTDYSFSNDKYVSVFAGLCKSDELLDSYIKKHYDLLECDYIGSEFGVDFGINTYDEDFLVAVVNKVSSDQIKDVFADAIVFELRDLEALFPNGLGSKYNTAIVIGRLKYEGVIKEVCNKEFGYFKFLGTFLNI